MRFYTSRFDFILPDVDLNRYISLTNQSIFLSASYDSCIRVFSYQNPQEPLMTHKVPALAQSSPQCLVDARWIAADTAATAGLDGAVRVWSMPEVIFDPSTATDEAHGVSSSQSPRQVWLGTHHPLLSSKAATAFVSTKSTSSSFNMSPVGLTSLDISADSASLLTASRDGSIAYWKLDEVLKQAVGNVAAGDGGDADNDDEDAQHKRRKGANGKKHISSTAALSSKRPSALFWHSPPVASNTVGSTSGPSYVCATNARVSQAVFDPQDPTKAVSGGYDGKLIEWDLFAATKDGNPKVSVRQTSDSRAILCVACPKQTASTGSARVVTGQMDRSICLWDLSSSSSSARVVMSNAHAGPVYSASCHPNEAHLFATAGGDGSVKIWDARSHKRALFALRTPSIRGKSSASGDQKLLACEWDRFTAEDEASAEGKGHVLLAGGEDCTVNVFRQS